MHVALIGLGNIGSHAAPLVARIPSVQRITLVDRDRYEERNVRNQSIHAADIGKPKVVVQARRLRSLRPDLGVESIVQPVEQVPLGALRADVVLAAVDTRMARQYINEACWTLGVPWVDSGVLADEGLVRISVFGHGPEDACLECAWDSRHYASLETAYPCGGTEPARTGASAALGAIAGAMLAMECERWLAGQRDPGRETVFDTSARKIHRTHGGRNPHCRFSHAGRVAGSEPVISRGMTMSILEEGVTLAVLCAGPFARRATCNKCGCSRAWVLAKRAMCGRCGTPLTAHGFDLVPQLRRSDLTKALLSRPLMRFGITDRDILQLGRGDAARFVEVGGAHA